ncbi:TauD/TfdA family dioxygenase [Mesorhizobium sp. M0924]|uniref:TauD/TfdA family dioxygenase n=1 Tax=unclassified Mesorhizobium TaxID=325217 RepID=UPI0004CFBFA5
MALKAQVESNGYAFLPRHASDLDAAMVAAALGEPIVPWDRSTVQQLVPRASSTPNTYSGIFGLGRFPLHTDLAHWLRPPPYLLLRCVRGFDDVPTLLVDGRSIVEAVTIDIVQRAVVRPRRPQSGEMRLLRLWETSGTGHLLRWDEIFLKPASPVGEVAFRKIREHLERVVPVPVALVDPGDTLIVDNWRMLHGRPAISAGRQDRRLERVYLGRLN